MKGFNLNITNTLRNDGYVHIPNIISSTDTFEITNLTTELIGEWREGKINSSDFWSYSNEKDGRILYRIQHFESYCPSVYSLLNKPIFRQLLDVVLDDKLEPNCIALIIKMPGCNGVPWHRDINEIAPHKKYNFSIFLDNAFPENGCIEVLPKSHIDSNDYSKIITAPSNSIKLHASMNDVIIHDVRLFHGSGASISSSIRRSIVIEFGK